MDLNRVAMFVRVVEAGSFTAAAASLGVPKSSVSRGISRLEDDLGVRLLQRTTRKLGLTDAGHAYFVRAREAVAGIDAATAAVSDMGKEPKGIVRFTAPADVGVSVLSDVLARFAREHPGIHVDLSLTARRVDLLEEGFDLALRAGRLEDSSLVARKIAAPEIALYASRAYVKRRGRPRDVAELASHECVLFRSRGGKATWTLDGPDGAQSVEVHGPINADDMLFVWRAVAAGAGVGLVPSFLCPRGMPNAPDLTRVLPEHAAQAAPLHVVMPSAQYVPARVALFRDFLVRELAAFAWQR